MFLQTALFFETVDEIYSRVFGLLRPGLTKPEVEVRFRRFTSATSRIHLSQGRLEVQISDLLESAPAPVQEALAHILLSKLFRQAVPPAMNSQYRLYLDRPDMRARIDSTRRERGAKRVTQPAGHHYDLDALFHQVNVAYFGNALVKPLLGWSRIRSRRILGHYDPGHHAIVLSPILDSQTTPEFLVEYVMFHEMLHIKHPTESGPSRRRIHTRAFREEEKTFSRFSEVKTAMRGLR